MAVIETKKEATLEGKIAEINDKSKSSALNKMPPKPQGYDTFLTEKGYTYFFPDTTKGKEDAQKFAKNLKALGYETSVVREQGIIDTETYNYMLRIGLAATKQPLSPEANALANRLAEAGIKRIAPGTEDKALKEVLSGGKPQTEEEPAAAPVVPKPLEKKKPSESKLTEEDLGLVPRGKPAPEEKQLPPKPKKYSKEEKDLMAHLNKVIEEAKEIHSSQYKVGSDYLEQYLADYEKLQKMAGGKRISEYVSHYVEVAISGVNMELWKRYAQKRLTAPVPTKVEPSIEVPLRAEAAPAERLMPSEEAMLWIKARYKKESGVDYEKNREMYGAIRDSFGNAESLASRIRFADQLRQNASESSEAMKGMEKDFKKKFPQEAKAFDALLGRVESAKEKALVAAKPVVMDDLYAWAGNDPVAKKFLDRNKEAIENMLKHAYGFELAKVLDYIDAAVVSRLEGTSTPKPKPRVILPKDADFEAVRKGLEVLYMAKGLQEPVFEKTKAQREELKGKYILVDTSTPELYMKPNAENILPPADKDGNVFIKYKGRTIWISEGAKQSIEEALRNGTSFNTVIFKEKSFTQVDAAGADLLVQYLHEKGWTNLEIVPWYKGPAKAGVTISEVPAGYWNKPVARAGKGEVTPKEVQTKKAMEREEAESPRTGAFEITEEASERFGRVLDSVAETSRFAVANQKENLENIVNGKDAHGKILFESVGTARRAAEMVREELLARGDLRSVSVTVVRDYWGVVSGAYVGVSELSEKAFMQRSKTPLVVPADYEGKAILSSAADRANLQDFLNKGTGNDTAIFRAGKFEKEAVEKYLARIGFPKENVTYSKLLKPEVEAAGFAGMLSGGEIWDISLTAATIPAAPVEEGESVAARGIKGGDELTKGRAREYYGSDSYRMWIGSLYPTSEVWLKQRLEAEAKAKGLKTEYEVSHALQMPSDVYQANSQDYRRMSEDQRAYTVYASGGQGFAYMALGRDKRRLFFQNEISKRHLTADHLEMHEGEARFSEDVQAEVTKHMLYMHTGPGKMSKQDKEYYPELSAQMLAVLSRYKTFDDFADAVGNNYVSAAIYDAALQLTEEALNLNLAYMAMKPEEKAKVREATFDLMWRSYVSLIAFETGPHPSKNPEQIQLDGCATALVDYLAGRGPGNSFQVKFPGTETAMTYKTSEAIVVRYNGKNVLAVPYIDEGGNLHPEKMYVVGERRNRTRPNEGYTYYDAEIYNPKKMFEIATPRSKTDSIGPAGLTYLFVWGANPPELKFGPKEPPKKKEEGPAPITIFFPEYYSPGGYVAVANDLYWDKVGVSFAAPKESVLPKLENGVLLLSTISGEMAAEESKFFIHPPRTRFSANGRELPVVEDYPTFRTYAYSSAYVDYNNGDAVYAFRKVGDKLDSMDFIPQNARRYAGMAEDELKKEGIFKIRVGTFDRRSGTIKYENNDQQSYFDRHITGSWGANAQDLRTMTKDEIKEMGISAEPNRYYYAVGSSHTAVPAKTSMEVGSHEDIGVTGSTKEDGMLYVNGNVPIISGEWKKKEGK